MKKSMKKDTEKQSQCIYICSECGSKDVEIRQWIRPNENNELAGNDCPEDEDCWCNECQEHNSLDVIEIEPKSNSHENE